MPVCQIEGGVKSKALKEGRVRFSLSRTRFRDREDIFEKEFPGQSVFSKALSFLALKCPQLSFSHDSRRSACSRAKSHA